jgi:hypothetical protein
MSYRSLNNTRKVPYTLNDPYNVCSYSKKPVTENFIPFNYVQSPQERLANQQAQQAVQQQIIQIHKKQELERQEQAEELDKKLKLIQKFDALQKIETKNREDTIRKLEAEVSALNDLIAENSRIDIN